MFIRFLIISLLGFLICSRFIILNFDFKQIQIHDSEHRNKIQKLIG